jgi:benzoylformate decarboxylase
VAKLWTKFACEVTRVQDLPTIVRRAVQTALSPPTGPVFLALPVDLQLESCKGLDLTPPRVPDRRVRPSVEALKQAAALLASARNPAILAGSRVADGDAIAELVAIAELLGAPVFSESGTAHGRVPFPPSHPLYGAALPLWTPDVRKKLESFDVIFATGTSLLRTYIYLEPARALPEHLKIVQLDEDAWQLGKTYPVDVGLIGDTKTGLAELHSRLNEVMSPRQKEAARKRGEEHASQIQKVRVELAARIEAESASRPMTPTTLMGAIARALPPDVAVIEEAATTTNGVLERLGAIKDPKGYFAHRGWALGWGLGCALGVKLAWPQRPVLAILGDGAALFGIQGLWSAAHHRIPVTFVIANNRQYRILKHCADVMPLPQMQAGKYVGMDLTEPEVDFVALARSLGVDAERVETPDAVSEKVRASFQTRKPLLVDVPLAQ